MIYRKVKYEDLPGIARLYKVCFNIEMQYDRYDYWYKYNDSYTAIVAEENGVIVGHNAFVINDYIHKGAVIKVALSAAGMVDAENVKNPGTFLKLIEATRDAFNFVDIIIAFPNKKAEPFWTRVLKFNTIRDNYFYITPDLLNITSNINVDFNDKRELKFIQKRTIENAKYTYSHMKMDDFEFIFKEYNGNAELVYINKISNKLTKALQYIFNLGYIRINVISVYGEILKNYGFVKGNHNVFVYQWQNHTYKPDVFECQMIDSDVF